MDIKKVIGEELSARGALLDEVEVLKKLQQLADSVGGEVYKGYSGRGMFGMQCWGVSVPDLDEALMEVGVLGLPRPRHDDLGRGYILYWPEYPYREEMEVEASRGGGRAAKRRALEKILTEGYVASGDLDSEDVPRAVAQLVAVFAKIGWPSEEKLPVAVEKWMSGDNLGLPEEEVTRIVEESSRKGLQRQAGYYDSYRMYIEWEDLCEKCREAIIDRYLERCPEDEAAKPGARERAERFIASHFPIYA